MATTTAATTALTVATPETESAPRAEAGRAAEAHLALVRRAFAFIVVPPERRDPAERAALFAPHFASLGPARANCAHDPAPQPGRDLFSGFSEKQLTLEKMSASGDRVISLVRFTGRHTGWYEGHAPTGRVMTAEGMVVHRIADGRIAEQWSILRWR